MRDFHAWIIEEGWWDDLGSTMRKGVDHFFPPTQTNTPPPPSPIQLVPTPPEPNTTPPNTNTSSPIDDITSQKNKYKQFLQLLKKGFAKYIPNLDRKNNIIEHLKNIAKAFVTGRHIETRYLDELLIAIHQDTSVVSTFKTSTFNDHHRLLRYIREIYESAPSIWYNKKERHSMHPNTSIDKNDLMNTVSKWSRSPNKYKEPKTETKSKRSTWSSSEVKEFFEKLFRKHVVKKVGGGYDRKPLKGIELMHLSNQENIELTDNDFNLIMAKINDG